MNIPRIAITLGDQAGIGPEIVTAALHDEALPKARYFVVDKRITCTPGKPTLQTARAAFDALEIAAEGLLSGSFDAVVTAPVSKEWLHKAGFCWPGQTEFFAEKLASKNHAMCLTGEKLTVGLATIHEPIAKVSQLLTIEKICTVGTLLADFCKKRGHARPSERIKIAVAGLNPHAGENGQFGREEIETIAPAIARLNESCQGVEFSGPAVPDAIFRDAAAGLYDAVLAMYHDQGLIPLKMLDFENAVNVTLGLPKPRLSPDHGTAYSLAGTGKASHKSMLFALKLACSLIEAPTPATSISSR